MPQSVLQPIPLNLKKKSFIIFMIGQIVVSSVPKNYSAQQQIIEMK